jgi:hypothetical protein
MSILLQKQAKVECYVFDFDPANREALQTSLASIPTGTKRDAIITVSDSFADLLTVLPRWKTTAENKQKEHHNPPSFFIVTINLDNLEDAFTNYNKNNGERDNPSPLVSVPEPSIAIDPLDFDDEDINLPEEDLEKLSEEIKRNIANEGNGKSLLDEKGTQHPTPEPESQRLSFDSYKEFNKYLSSLLTQLRGANRNGCFIFLQSGMCIDDNLLDSQGLDKMRFIGFPCSQGQYNGILRNLPQKGDKNWAKNAGAYYGSGNELRNTNSEPFLPIELKSLQKLAQTIGGM